MVKYSIGQEARRAFTHSHCIVSDGLTGNDEEEEEAAACVAISVREYGSFFLSFLGVGIYPLDLECNSRSLRPILRVSSVTIIIDK